jgi:histidine triad (HIT) family protein
MDNCIFCRIAAGKAPSRIVLENDDVVAFHDLTPRAPTHVLVVPRRHVASLAQAAPGDAGVLGALLLAAAEVARITGVEGEGYRVVVNTGAAAGQTVHHVHVHVLGGRAFGWPPG